MNNYDVYILKTSFMHFINYTYIVFDRYSKEAAIIDPAWSLRAIKDKIESLNADVKAILLTHSHFDHTNLVAPLVKEYCCNVFISQVEADFYNYTCKNLIKLAGGDRIGIGESEFLCILTPGHTAGSMCYWLEDCFFTGDTVFYEGCGICEGGGASPNEMYKSFQRIKQLLPQDTRVYPAHCYGKFPGQPFRSLLKDNIYFQLEKEEQFVDFRMSRNKKGLFDFK